MSTSEKAKVGSGGKASLSSLSPYEQMFKTRHRGRGRPDGGGEPLFTAEGVDRLLVDVARRRAYAVVHEEQKRRMAEVFQAELRVLRRRGAEVVARDVGRGRSLDETRA